MARRPKYSPEVVKRICDAVAIGATYELACKYGGITRETLNVWRHTKPDFSDAIEEAEGRGAIGWLAKIERAANEGTWQAAAWKLERRYPQDYGRTIQEHQGKDGVPLRVTFAIDRTDAEGPPKALPAATLMEVSDGDG